MMASNIITVRSRPLLRYIIQTGILDCGDPGGDGGGKVGGNGGDGDGSAGFGDDSSTCGDSVVKALTTLQAL